MRNIEKTFLPLTKQAENYKTILHEKIKNAKKTYESMKKRCANYEETIINLDKEIYELRFRVKSNKKRGLTAENDKIIEERNKIKNKKLVTNIRKQQLKQLLKLNKYGNSDFLNRTPINVCSKIKNQVDNLKKICVKLENKKEKLNGLILNIKNYKEKINDVCEIFNIALIEKLNGCDKIDRILLLKVKIIIEKFSVVNKHLNKIFCY